MPKFIALLRGINVGGRNKLKMDALKASLQSSGFTNITSYIQSGNLVFCTETTDKRATEQAIENTIFNSAGFKVSALVFDLQELQLLQQQHPFFSPDSIASLYFTFLAEKPETENWNEHLLLPNNTDKFVLQGKCIYLTCPGGYGKTKYTNSYFEKKIGVNATTRNWKTVAKLIELAS